MIRHWLYHNLDLRGWTQRGMSPLNYALIVLILAAVALAILETEPDIFIGREALFARINLAFAIIFTAEFLARLYCCVERPETGSNLAKRLHFFASPWVWIDIIVILATLSPYLGGNLLIFRLLRILRIVSLANLGRLSGALVELRMALRARRYELFITVALAGMLIILGATALYWAEGHIQPDKFGSIPRALWWSVVTLTTIGYGDVSPITPLGKIIAGMVAIAGVGMVAMPTGILAAAFSEAMQQRTNRERNR